MELRHLRYFVVVAEEGHFTRAAQRLSMQQPPLSQQIRALEQELGFDLFRRHPKGAELTAGGVVFLQEAKAILDGVEQGAARAARAASGSAGNISVGFTSSAAAHPIIPQIMRSYRAAWPGVTLEFREGNAAELTDALSAATLDIAFLRLPVSQPPGIHFKRLLEEEMLLVLPVGHPLLRKHTGRSMPTISLKSLKDEQFILVRRRGAPGMYSNLIDACVRAGFTPNITVEVERMLTNISLVAAGAGISAVPASMKGFHEDAVVYCHIQEAGPDLNAPLTMACRDGETKATVRHFMDEAARFSRPGKAKKSKRQ
ncbi:LysR family transcriptional regulator [Noviherbaspirillum saxi]|uniref:LysR family transcriptional regulator n=1 Tax=Noviherbaspirillum saxi TaxID=2320863 RepID=A0A3A3G2Z1_9BURK|nr:LysR family transcriptional regulator [Noviherbaspirillum saxi]RJF92433.1 LysR family transcriptional regulator [Noviherbaspirillum saxi]